MSSSSEVTKVCCNTHGKQIKISYQWIIANFSLIYESLLNEYESSIFSEKPNGKFKWYLQLVKFNEKDEGFSIYLFYTPSIESKIRAEYKLSLLNSRGQETKVRKKTALFDSQKDEGYGIFKFIKINTLLNEANGLLPENKLTIFCEISFVPDITNVSDQPNSFPGKCFESKLSQDFGKLFEDPKFSDVTLVVSDREFKAHKNILAARSDVFAAMFEHDFEEATSNRVVITDMEPEVLKELLYFIYTDKVLNLNKMASDLLVAADKYALENLKNVCEEAMSSNLSIETAMKTLMLADRHGAKILEGRTKDFIKTYIEDIMETQSWKNSTKYFL